MIYIYALACPVTGRTRYIGKCKNTDHRLSTHISKAKSAESTHHCARWIATLLRDGLKPTIRVLIALPEGADWQLAERLTIARYRRHGFDLTNLTGGGDGFHDLAPEAVLRKSEARRRWFAIPENRDRIISALTAGRDSPEHRKKLSQKIAASWLNPSTKSRYLEGMSKPDAVLRRMAASTKRFDDPEYRRKHFENMGSIWSTPERKQEAKDRAIELHADPEIVERRRASITAAHRRPDVKARMTATREEVASRPEVKQKKSDKLRQSWADTEAGAKRRAALSSENAGPRCPSQLRRNGKTQRRSRNYSPPSPRQSLAPNERRRHKIAQHPNIAP